MADESNKPKDPAEGAGTKAHKPTKAEQAKLPGGEDFDVEGASSEDFDKHYEILARRAKLAGLSVPEATPLVALAAEASPVKAVPAEPNPGDIRMVNKAGEFRYFDPITVEALGEDRKGWEEAVAKPTDI